MTETLNMKQLIKQVRTTLGDDGKFKMQKQHYHFSSHT
jgi:hypothetical protein